MERILDKRLKGKFEMVNLEPGTVVFKNTKYDTRNMGIKEANAAIKSGATFIKRIEKKSKNKKSIE